MHWLCQLPTGPIVYTCGHGTADAWQQSTYYHAVCFAAKIFVEQFARATSMFGTNDGTFYSKAYVPQIANAVA